MPPETTTTLPPSTTTAPPAGATTDAPTGTTTDAPPAGTTTDAPSGSTTAPSPVTTDPGGNSAPPPSNTLPPANGGNGNGGQLADPFQALLDSVRGIDLHASVNIEEAQSSRRLYTVANYVAAGLPDAIRALNDTLTSDSPGRLTLVGKAAFLASPEGARVEAALNRMAEDHNDRAKLTREARAQFDLGTESAESVNAEFKTAFRRLVDLCADELLAFDPGSPQVAGNPLVTPDRIEQAVSFLRRLKRVLIEVMELMSRYGRLGVANLISKWATICTDGVAIVSRLGANHVATDDADQRHPWAVVAALTGKPREQSDAYLVHAREGADLLGAIIEIYDAVMAQDELSLEDAVHLRAMFHDTNYFSFPDPAGGAALTVAQRLRRGSTLIQENWIPEWS